MTHARDISTQTILPLRSGWDICLTAPDACPGPAALPECAGIPATAPGTVVAALRDAGSPALQHRSVDDFDAWYRCRFSAATPAATETARLIFEGLATIADVWLNGEHLLRSENMFLRHEVDVTTALRASNEICIRFSSLNRFLEARRPRPQWRTHLVDHSQLRWVRTTLIGRMPGWHENARQINAAGPWRPVSLVIDRVVHLRESDFNVRVEDGDGVVEARIGVRVLAGDLSQALLQVGEHSAEMGVIQEEAGGRVSLGGALRIPRVDLWWPHTHGPQPLYDVRVTLRVDGAPVRLDFGRTGFRSLQVDTADGGFGMTVNGEAVFLRGACWTTVDAARLTADGAAYDRPLALAREAGMNMLRIPGTGFYESDAFYDRCAELGFALWQDFAFALMDYPATDAAFRASVTTEAEQLLGRLQLNPALMVVCGNSECEAMAAIHGLKPERWANPLFEDLLPRLTRRARRDVAYIPSSQWGGAMPFHADTGVSHYYGVGAYLKPPEDARRSAVRFATECLGFSNIPEEEAIDAFLADGETPGRYPSWKAGVPRNVGAGWDFGDVRDHYIRSLFQEDPARAMYCDVERYLALGRVVSGELMAAAFAEWRRSASPCRGALLWFYQDLWAGPGWGVIDAHGQPKSVYFYLKRAMAPLTVFFTDEGLNGLRVHVVNERPTAVEGTLRITLYRNGQTRVHQGSAPVRIGPRGAIERNVEEVLGFFVDASYAYRHGQPLQNVTVATLETAAPGPAPAFHFPTGIGFPREADLGLQAQARECGGGAYRLSVRASRFAQAVRIVTKTHLPEDNYFHLEPEREFSVVLQPKRAARASLTGHVEALNTFAQTRITVLQDQVTP